jgi:hypothetical protein
MLFGRLLLVLCLGMTQRDSSTQRHSFILLPFLNRKEMFGMKKKLKFNLNVICSVFFTASLVVNSM